jgi:PEP-CTERM motif
MNKNLKLLSLAALAMGGLGATQAMAFTQGDLIMGFRATGGIGASTVIQIDLGDTATVFRDATVNINSLANIGTLLDNTYGIGAGGLIQWYERTDLLFGAAGSWSNSNPPSNLQNGDPDLTNYATKARNTIGANEFAKNSTLNTPNNTTTEVSIATDTTGLGNSMAGQSVGVAVALATSVANTWEDFNLMPSPPAQGNAFTGWTGGIQQAFSVGNRGTYVTTGTPIIAEGALDLFRSTASANDALGSGQYDAISGTTAAQARVPEFQGILLIDQAGNISFDVAPVPEPTSAMLLGMTGLLGALARRRRSVS